MKRTSTKHESQAGPIRRLADRMGILPEYVDQTGREVRTTSDATRAAILGAMGLDASTPDRAREALEDVERRDRAALLAPVRVRLRGSRDASRVRVPLPGPGPAEARWRATLTVEGGESHRSEGRAAPDRKGDLVLDLGADPPEGYHTLELAISGGGREDTATQALVVVPRTCRRAKGVFGVFANLYTVRSAEDWGVGDLSTLGALLEWTAREGGDFLGINPLHALRNRGWEVSPYSPVSRLYRNPLYLDPGPPAPEHREERERLRASGRVEYEPAMALKRRALEPLHAADRPDEAYRRYLEAEGEPLERFATFEALADHFGHGDWRRWPDSYRDSRSAEVAAFRAERAREVDFHRWLQFRLDRELENAAERGRRAGLRIGLYQDLAIGSSSCGSDIWANPHLFLDGISIGSPPDEYSAGGQNWGLPPVAPRALRDAGYDFWIRLLRASFRHAGALRIDHVMGLFRQFWIPEGMSGTEGAYVRFPADDLVGILVLEARRHDALVVGEDLGTVPPEVPPALHRRGILSSRVLYFEQVEGRFRPAAEYEPASLATANTHDMAPLAGFWSGRDIELRCQAGELEPGEAVERARAAREKVKRAMLDRLAADGALRAGGASPDSAPVAPAWGTEVSGAELRGAVHAFLCSTPAAMVGFNLDDLVGEKEPVNLPGVPLDRYPSWTRRLATPVESLPDDPDVRAALRCDARVEGRRSATRARSIGEIRRPSPSNPPDRPRV